MRKFDYGFLDNGLLPAKMVDLTSSIYSLRLYFGKSKHIRELCTFWHISCGCCAFHKYGICLFGSFGRICCISDKKQFSLYSGDDSGNSYKMDTKRIQKA